MDKDLFLKALGDFGVQIIDLLKQGISVAQKEVPGFISQALAYWTAMAWYRLIVYLVLIMIFINGAIYSFNWCQRIARYEHAKDEVESAKLRDLYFSDMDEVALWLGILAAAVSLTFLVVLLSAGIPTVLKAYNAPELFLIEHIKDLF